MAAHSHFRHLFLLAFLASTFLLCTAAPSFSNGTSEVLTNDSGNITVTDPDTGDVAAQGTASDGVGNGVIATLWVVCAFVIGLPIATTGLLLGRVSSGIGLGLALAVGSTSTSLSSTSTVELLSGAC